MALSPYGPYILVEILNAAKSKGGIYMPPTDASSIREAKVIAVGDGTYDGDGDLHPPRVSVGDTIWLLPGANSGAEFDVSLETGSPGKIVHEDTILAIVT